MRARAIPSLYDSKGRFHAERCFGLDSRRMCEHMFVCSLVSVRYEREAFTTMRVQLHPEGFACESALGAAS